MATTQTVAVFQVHARRTAAAAKALLGETFAGVLCVDRYGAYTWVTERGLCWSHLLRDFQAMAERHGSGWYGQRLVRASQRVLAHWKAWDQGDIDRETMGAHIAVERRGIVKCLERAAAAAHAAPKTRRVARDLLGLQEAMWRFTTEPDLAPTNNLAERMLSVMASLKAQDRAPFRFVVDIIDAHNTGRPAPSLLPVHPSQG